MTVNLSAAAPDAGPDPDRPTPPAEWLRAAVRAAGFHHGTDFAHAVAAPYPRVSSWLRGQSQPLWRDVPALAGALRLSVLDVARGAWGQTPGELCPCGCGGVLVEPAKCRCGDPASHTMLSRLPARQPCIRCGVDRFHHGKTRHQPLCPRCGQQTKTPRTTLHCVGYTEFGKVRHARTCYGTLERTPGQIRRSRKASKLNQEQLLKDWGTGRLAPREHERFFIDAEKGRYRCRACVTGSQSLAARLARVEEHAAKPPRSATQLRRLESARMAGADMSAAHRVGTRGRPKSRAHAEAAALGRIVAEWSVSREEDLPKCIVRRCTSCETLLFVAESVARNNKYGVPRRHMHCPRDVEPVLRRGPHGHSNLCRDVAWAVQTQLGQRSQRAVARKWGVSLSTLQEAVHKVMQALPPPELVQRRYQRLVSALHSSISVPARSVEPK